MHFVLLADHSADICPTSNAKTRALMMEIGPTVPKIAEQSGVKIVAGPYVSREHTTVVIVEADKADSVDRFLAESRLSQWNSVRILPSLPMAQAMQEFEAQPALF